MMTAVMAVTMSFMFVSCGGDDDSGGSNNGLVGWYVCNNFYDRTVLDILQKEKDGVISIVGSHLKNDSNPFYSDGKLRYYNDPYGLSLQGDPSCDLRFIHIVNKNTMFYTSRLEYYKKDCPAVAGRDLIFIIKTGTSVGDIGAYPAFTSTYSFDLIDNKLWVPMPEWIFTVYNSTLMQDGGFTYVPLPFKIGEAL